MANPKTADADCEMREYLERCKEQLKVQQEKAYRAKMAVKADSMPFACSMPFSYQPSWPSGSYAGIQGSPEPPRAQDPHKVLAAQIEKLKSVEPDKPGKRMPDYTQTITAWRGWSVKNEQLTALAQSDIWKPKTAKAAKCSSAGNGHRAPSRECSCGYWSFNSMDLLTEALRSYTGVTVVGAVEIWGRVIECENGYRSEFAYPKELWLLKPDMEYLSWTYGVAVRNLKAD